MNIIFIDDENSQAKCRHRRNVLTALQKVANVVVPSATFKNRARQLANINSCIKNKDNIVVIWNSLRPISVWAIDLCKRYGRGYCVVERGLIPNQGVDNYCLFSGGMCFDCLNIDPKYFNTSTYAENVKKINRYYYANDYKRAEPTDKVVIIGQIPTDTTMTHFALNFKNFETLIEQTKQKEKNVIFCPHPQLAKAYRKNFRTKNFPCDISYVKTIEECLDAKYVISYASSIIYELRWLEIPVKIIGLGNNRFPTERNWINIKHCHSTALDFHFNSKTTQEDMKVKLELASEISVVNSNSSYDVFAFG